MNEPELTELIDSLLKLSSEHAWYPVAATVCLLVTQFLKVPAVRPFVWDHIPKRFQWTVPLGETILLGFGKSFTEGADFKTAAITLISTIAVSWPLAMGFDAGLKNSPLPWPPPKPRNGTGDGTQT